MEEEQNLEIEALQAIYGDDFQELDKDPLKFQIALVPNPGESEGNHVGVTLEVTFPSKYPNVLPEWSLIDVFGITDEQQNFLESKIRAQAEESIGAPMVFNLAQICKEWLDENNIDTMELEKIRLRKIEEERERKRLEGTRVTKETFAAWADKFYAPKIAEEKKLEAERRKKMTGRALFEKYSELVMSDAKFAEQEGEGGEAVSIDWNVFSHELEDDVDLDSELAEGNE
eukprot:TRINITY_DN8676_c0_g1_i1.p1 TRINITY_DN8676_c0_g1~~TRINITY_DN8676_c0_g1_i1.p1  ORF type:complete len:229 (+),score=59.20 TRINITY_DN8676_c0_g1_i1:114-800(+)